MSDVEIVLHLKSGSLIIRAQTIRSDAWGKVGEFAEESTWTNDAQRLESIRRLEESVQRQSKSGLQS